MPACPTCPTCGQRNDPAERLTNAILTARVFGPHKSMTLQEYLEYQYAVLETRVAIDRCVDTIRQIAAR